VHPPEDPRVVTAWTAAGIGALEKAVQMQRQPGITVCEPTRCKDGHRRQMMLGNCLGAQCVWTPSDQHSTGQIQWVMLQCVEPVV
jgi:hypothetical protein